MTVDIFTTSHTPRAITLEEVSKQRKEPQLQFPLFEIVKQDVKSRPRGMPREQQATMEYLALQAGAEESDIIKDRLLSNSFQFNLFTHYRGHLKNSQTPTLIAYCKIVRNKQYYANFRPKRPQKGFNWMVTPQEFVHRFYILNKQNHVKVLLKRFHLIGNTIGFHLQTQKLELHTK